MAEIGIDQAAGRGFDVTIVGAGIAGCFLAEKLAAAGASVLLVERGEGAGAGSDGGEGYALDVTGLPYPENGSRLAGFGGTSNHWGGQSHPLSREVFAGRPGIPGWPISWNDFAHDIGEAADWLNIGAALENSEADFTGTGIFRGSEHLEIDTFRLSNPVVRLGEGERRARILANAQIHVLANARAVDLDMAETGRTIAGVQVRDTKKGVVTAIPVRALVLATGGVETPRLMLYAARHLPAGNPLAGGPNGLTGKFLQEHPVLAPWDVFFDSRVELARAGWHAMPSGMVQAVLRPSEDFLASHALPRIGIFFNGMRTSLSGEEREELEAVEPGYAFSPPDYVKSVPLIMLEQSPHAGSHVALSSRTDPAGYPLARFHLEFAADDVEAYPRAFRIVGALLGQPNLGHVRIRAPFRSADPADWPLGWGNHHMGTTRMAAHREEGVVDPDGRVHGLDNLYIAGSGVFANSDYVNPTLNLVALACRTARRIEREFGLVHHISRFAALRFGTGRPENIYLKSGWSFPEDGAIWTIGPEARIDLPVRGASGLKLDFRPFRSGWTGTQIEIEINGKTVFSGRALDALNRMFRFDPSEKTVAIVIRIANPMSPKEIGMSDDPRKLGLYLRAMSVE